MTIPWLPSAFPESSRLINEIVLGEESDLYQGRVVSHFDLYLEAMRQAGANTSPITAFLEHLRTGFSLSESLARSGAPLEAQSFVRATFAIIGQNKPHVTAAAFTYGREDLIPDMFREIVKDLHRTSSSLELFEYYLERHIEVDGDSHGPMALRMMEQLCGDNERKKQEARNAANEALDARVQLWDSILDRILRRRK